MASFKCPDCGATLTDDSKFCKYCGAKIDDGTKRVEVKIDKRVEDVAAVRRVELDEKEYERRVKKEKQQNIAKWIRRGILLAIFLVGILLIMLDDKSGGLSAEAIMGVFILIAEGVYLIITFFHKMGF